MSGLPEITIVAAVYFPSDERGELREAGFRESLKSWNENLRYDGELSLVVVRDGYPALGQYPEWGGAQYNMAHPRSGLGGSFNLAFQEALSRSPLVCNIVDDYVLATPFDLTPWAQMLLECENVGAVRLLAPYPGTSGTIQPLPHGWAVVLNRHNLAGGLRPSLYHRRFFDAYGWFDEGLSAWETERLFNERFCQAQGPESVLALPLPWRDGIGSTVLLGQESPKE